MHRKRHTPVAKGLSIGAQILRKLRTAEQFHNQGQTGADVCRSLEIALPRITACSSSMAAWRRCLL